MPIAVHSALWVSEWGEDLAPHIETAARLGFDGVEVSLLGLDESAATRLAQVADGVGVKLLCTTGLARDEDVTSEDASLWQAGVDALRRAADVVAACAAQQLCGVIHAPWGAGDGGDRAAKLERSARALGTVAPVFHERGITLGIEAVNRFETDLITTSAQACELAEMVGEVNVGVHLDTFHMNIEERSVADAVASAADHLVHMHVVDNDRGAPGRGHIDFDPTFEALESIGYDGWLGLELFVRANVAVSADLNIWRPIEHDPTEAAAAGLAFVRQRWDG